MAATVVIPARLGSTRFTAKMLASQTGRPLVQHVVDRVRQCRRVEQILVATDHPSIVEALAKYGTRSVLTSPNHASGTDRIAEVAASLSDDDAIINVQGDEPEIDPAAVDRLIELLESSDEQMVTAATAFPSGADPNNPNLVKVVVDPAGHALYFSRSPIPHVRDGGADPTQTYLLHLGVYGFRRQALLRFAAWKPSRLEQLERLEQLRALENGIDIAVVLVSHASQGIDTEQQYLDFVARTRSRGTL